MTYILAFTLFRSTHASPDSRSPIARGVFFPCPTSSKAPSYRGPGGRSHGRKIHFNSGYEEFQPKILHYLTCLAGPQEAEDLVQEVFEKVNRALKDFRGESKLSTWLYRIATNTAIDKLKTQSFKLLSGRSTLGEDSGVEDKDVWTGEQKPSPDQGLIREETNCSFYHDERNELACDREPTIKNTKA